MLGSITVKIRTLLVAAALSSWSPDVLAGDWPGYRGPNRDGRSSETGLLERWPESGPVVRWRIPLGTGYSGIAVAGGRVVTLFGAGGDELAASFDAESGEEVWRFRLGANFRNNQGHGPRSTPTIDGDLVYVLGARSKLYALETATGSVRWGLDLVKDLGSRVPEWGTSTSPLIDGGHLIADVAGNSA